VKAEKTDFVNFGRLFSSPKKEKNPARKQGGRKAHLHTGGDAVREKSHPTAPESITQSIQGKNRHPGLEEGEERVSRLELGNESAA